MKAIIILYAMLLSCFTWAAVDAFEFDTPQQEAQYYDLIHELRCPKCQNNSIADSNAELAGDLRLKVYQLTMQGDSKAEIKAYLVARYGIFIDYRPPVTRATLLLWVLPLVPFLVGFVFIVRRQRQFKRQPKSDWGVAQEQAFQKKMSQSTTDTCDESSRKGGQ
ncbi:MULTISPECIES: cytochrome c-type biogenesis protein [unclassified Vibrio]|uniref:Cytochrome c-type biogenesis protein n=1 Tax=Vibrio sp. HB236076 TaxID=3232307 RepID=A0AB39HJC8_9VIBR|nr:cytochrome c-type biogenesis protein [Vibrio sp. HB161653]MDP5254767.1 cytochrome c-type biogenesis protein CcmH [Vibrio sp. HB161653]